MNWRTLDGSPPLIIAHRGASGLLPEHTLASYALALDQGADVIEPDLVPSADGVLFARHEPMLSVSTDVDAHPELTGYRVDGEWYSQRLPAAVLDRLRARQPFPGRDRSHDDCYPLPRWSAILDWAARAAAAHGRPLVLYPEIKHPAELAAEGVDPVPFFIESLASVLPALQVWVQCFAAEPLRRVQHATGCGCALLLDRDDDWHAAIAAHAGWLSRLAVHKEILTEELIASAHTAGLRVDVWTFRDDAVDANFDSIDDELAWALQSGADGLFCDFPQTGVKARSRLLV